MAGRGKAEARKDVRAFVQQNVAEDFLRVWRALRDDRDKLTNLRTLWTRAYAQHCAAVFDAEQRAAKVDELQKTHKHVRGLWATLAITSKAARAKIRATGKWYNALPDRERETITAALPATKDALYYAATFEGTDLPRLLAAKSIGPETTTAQFRDALGKATPQDRLRNAKPVQGHASGGIAEHLVRRVTIVCETPEGVAALIEFTQSSSHAYAIESSPL